MNTNVVKEIFGKNIFVWKKIWVKKFFSSKLDTIPNMDCFWWWYLNQWCMSANIPPPQCKSLMKIRFYLSYSPKHIYRKCLYQKINFVPEKICMKKKNLGQTNSLGWIFLGKKFFWVKKNLGVNFFLVKTWFGQEKIFGLKEFLGWKNFWVENVFSRKKIFG